MPRKRMIDPDIWDSLQFSSLPLAGRILFIGMFSLADDEGRLRANPGYLKKTIFGYDMDITPTNVAEWELSIIKSELVKAYRNGHENYILVTNFPKYQKINHPTPSKLPEPPQSEDGYITTIEQLTNGYIRTNVHIQDTLSNAENGITETDIKIGDSLSGTVGLQDKSSMNPSQYSIISINKVNKNSIDKIKVKFKDNVMLTEKEYNDLIKEYGKKKTDNKIDTLSDYKKSKGKKYKDDAATLRNWFRNDKKQEKQSSSSYFSGAGETPELREAMKNIPTKRFNVDKKDGE
jgi:hypothetical protein